MANIRQDALFEKMEFSEWSTTIRSKVQSSWNLHKQFPADMDFFIMLSSVSGIIGTIGQANYAAGNTYQDALARYRVLMGQKAIALDLGWMSDVGFLAENEGIIHTTKELASVAKISETEFHALLEYYCNPSLKICSPLNAQQIVGLLSPAQFRSKGLEPPSWTQSPIFSPLAQIELQESLVMSRSSNAETNYTAEFVHAESPADVVVEALVNKLAHALSINQSEVDTSNPLHTYGVDSLLAVELRSWFAKIFSADLAVFDIMGQGNSIQALGTLVTAKSSLRIETIQASKRLMEV